MQHEIDDRKYYSRPGNIGKATSLDIGVDAGFYPKPWLTFQLSAQLNFVRFKSDFYTGALETKGQSLYTQALVQLKLKGNWTMQLDGNYPSQSKNVQLIFASSGRLNYSVSKGLSSIVTVKFSATDLFLTDTNKGDIAHLHLASARFKTLSDTRAALLTVSVRIGKRVEGQRKQIESGAETEVSRVKD